MSIVTLFKNMFERGGILPTKLLCDTCPHVHLSDKDRLNECIHCPPIAKELKKRNGKL